MCERPSDKGFRIFETALAGTTALHCPSDLLEVFTRVYMYGAFMIRTRMVYYDADALYPLDYRAPKDPSIPCSQLRLPASIHLRNAERDKNVWSAPGTGCGWR
jgi:hypothetical protein